MKALKILFFVLLTTFVCSAAIAQEHHDARKKTPVHKPIRRRPVPKHHVKHRPIRRK